MKRLFRKLIRRLFYDSDAVVRELVLLQKQNLQIMEDLSKLQKAVERETTVVQSVVALIGKMAEQIRNIPTNDPETQQALNDFADKIDKQSDILAAAVEANTFNDGTDAPAPGDGGTPTPAPGGDGGTDVPVPGSGDGGDGTTGSPTTTGDDGSGNGGSTGDPASTTDQP